MAILKQLQTRFKTKPEKGMGTTFHAFPPHYTPEPCTLHVDVLPFINTRNFPNVF